MPQHGPFERVAEGRRLYSTPVAEHFPLDGFQREQGLAQRERQPRPDLEHGEMILHELPVHKFVHLMSLRRQNVELVELEVSENSPFANTYVQDIALPEGVILAAIVRAGHAMVVRGSTEILPGDYVICLGAGSISQWAYALPGELEGLAAG